MKENKIKERMISIMNDFREVGKSDELMDQNNKMVYELQCSTKRPFKKLGKANFGYY